MFLGSFSQGLICCSLTVMVQPNATLLKTASFDGDTVEGTLLTIVSYHYRCLTLQLYNPQSRQSARLFLQSSDLGPPHPHRRRMCPPFGWGGVACGRGVGGSQFGRGDRHCGTLGIYVQCATTDMTYCWNGLIFDGAAETTLLKIITWLAVQPMSHCQQFYHLTTSRGHTVSNSLSSD